MTRKNGKYMFRSEAAKFCLLCTVAVSSLSLYSAAAVARALASRPDVSGAAFYGVLDLTEIAQDVPDNALDNGAAGMSSGNRSLGMHSWGQIIGQTAHEGERGGVNGFGADTAGFAFGADTRRLIDKAVLGIGISYGHTNVDAEDVSLTGTDIDSYQAWLYGDFDLGNRTFLHGMATYGFNRDDNSRHNANGPGVTAQGTYNASEYAALFKIGHHFSYGGAVLTPGLLVHWVNYDPDAYTETGAGINDMIVNQKTMNVFELGVGGDVAWKHRNRDGSWLAPDLHAGYRYDLVGDRIQMTSTFIGGGGSFVTQGPAPARGRFNAGASLTLYTLRACEFKVSYDLDYKSDYLANSGIVRASIKF